MSKKVFKSDLDFVFSPEAQYEPNIDDSPWLLNTVATPSARKPGQDTNVRRPTKSFSTSLDSLFAAASSERPRESQPKEEQATTRLRERPRRALSPFSGLDGLIRDTTGGKAIMQQIQRDEEEASSAPKRVTFTYDRDRFAKLKQIARQEGAYLKDIISNLLNDYVSQYHGPTN